MARPRRPGDIWDPDSRYIAARLREAREERGLTQAEVAQRIDVSHTLMSKLERSDQYVRALHVVKLARVYEKPYDYFLPPLGGPDAPTEPDAASGDDTAP